MVMILIMTMICYCNLYRWRLLFLLSTCFAASVGYLLKPLDFTVALKQKADKWNKWHNLSHAHLAIAYSYIIIMFSSSLYLMMVCAALEKWCKIL